MVATVLGTPQPIVSGVMPLYSKEAKLSCRAMDRRFPMLFMAPEGTCGDGRCILRFRTGAFVPGVAVLPVALSYNKRSHNPAWTIMNEGWHFVSSPALCLHCNMRRLCSRGLASILLRGAFVRLVL